ncbi:MAG: ABC transporter ATP-binding protein [Hyphomicrobiaceae bacterium]
MLEIRSLSVNYGTIEVLKGLSIDVKPGEIVTIIGPNGAGKTTLLRTISGLKEARAGSIRFGGRDITRAAPHSIVRAGVTQVLQGHQVFAGMSVLENLRIGAFTRADRSRQTIEQGLEEIYAFFPVLRARGAQLAGTLSGGEQIMLAIGRAAMARPEVLLLDEPSLGLAPKVVDVVFEALQGMNKAGRTMVLVEQNAELAFDLAHRGYLLVLGRIVLEGATSDMRQSAEVAEFYLGSR